LRFVHDRVVGCIDRRPVRAESPRFSAQDSLGEYLALISCAGRDSGLLRRKDRADRPRLAAYRQ
jgi:hypothetical protein